MKIILISFGLLRLIALYLEFFSSTGVLVFNKLSTSIVIGLIKAKMSSYFEKSLNPFFNKILVILRLLQQVFG